MSCSVTSKTGSGVSSEGGTLSMTKCSICGCAAHGVALFADLYGQGSEAVIQDCEISNNAMNGVLIREDSRLRLESSQVVRNGLHGLAIKVTPRKSHLQDINH